MDDNKIRDEPPGRRKRLGRINTMPRQPPPLVCYRRPLRRQLPLSHPSAAATPPSSARVHNFLRVSPAAVGGRGVAAAPLGCGSSAAWGQGNPFSGRKWPRWPAGQPPIERASISLSGRPPHSGCSVAYFPSRPSPSSTPHAHAGIPSCRCAEWDTLAAARALAIHVGAPKVVRVPRGVLARPCHLQPHTDIRKKVHPSPPARGTPPAFGDWISTAGQRWKSRSPRGSSWRWQPKHGWQPASLCCR